MRTTLKIDDDVLAAARELADSTGCSLGKAVSELARKGLSGADAEYEFVPVVGRGFAIRLIDGPPFAKRITPEEVRRALDEFP